MIKHLKGRNKSELRRANVKLVFKEIIKLLFTTPLVFLVLLIVAEIILIFLYNLKP